MICASHNGLLKKVGPQSNEQILESYKECMIKGPTTKE